MASQWDGRNHSFISQVNLGQDLFKLFVKHGRSEGQTFVQSDVHFSPFAPGLKEADQALGERQTVSNDKGIIGILEPTALLMLPLAPEVAHLLVPRRL